MVTRRLGGSLLGDCALLGADDPGSSPRFGIVNIFFLSHSAIGPFSFLLTGRTLRYVQMSFPIYIKKTSKRYDIRTVRRRVTTSRWIAFPDQGIHGQT